MKNTIDRKSFVTNFNKDDMDMDILEVVSRNLNIDIWFGDPVNRFFCGKKMPVRDGAIGLYVDRKVTDLTTFWESYHSTMEWINKP